MPIVEMSVEKEDVTEWTSVVCATCAGVLRVPGIPCVSGALVLANVGGFKWLWQREEGLYKLSAHSRLYSEPIVSASERSLAIQDLNARRQRSASCTAT
jgi:hypothetical protein